MHSSRVLCRLSCRLRVLCRPSCRLRAVYVSCRLSCRLSSWAWRRPSCVGSRLRVGYLVGAPLGLYVGCRVGSVFCVGRLVGSVPVTSHVGYLLVFLGLLCRPSIRRRMHPSIHRSLDAWSEFYLSLPNTPM